MNLFDIENLSFAELKAQKAELLEAITASTVPMEEVADRYLQARMDAKHRDERLAEQAETLAALKEGLEAVKEREAVAAKASNEVVSAMTNEAAQFKKTTDAAIAELQKAGESYVSIIDDLQTDNKALILQVAELNQRCDCLKGQAEKYAEAISGCHKLTTDAINAQMIAQADKGE